MVRGRYGGAERWARLEYMWDFQRIVMMLLRKTQQNQTRKQTKTVKSDTTCQSQVTMKTWSLFLSWRYQAVAQANPVVTPSPLSLHHMDTNAVFKLILLICLDSVARGSREIGMGKWRRLLLVLELMAVTETRLEMVTIRTEFPESENRCSLVSLSNVKLLDRARCWTSWHPNSYFHVKF